MNIRPLYDRVLVRRLPPPASEGLVVIPDAAVEKSTWGQVVAVGLGRRTESGGRIPPEVKAGDVVIFGPYTDFDRDDLVMIQEADIRAVVHNA